MGSGQQQGVLVGVATDEPIASHYRTARGGQDEVGTLQVAPALIRTGVAYTEGDLSHDLSLGHANLLTSFDSLTGAAERGLQAELVP
jgi:hypothetical protein